MVGKQIPRIPVSRKRSPLFVVTDVAVSTVLVSFLLGSGIWLGFVLAGRSDVLSFRECVGVGLGLFLVRVVDLAVTGRVRGQV
jgi:hypothetical protein